MQENRLSLLRNVQDLARAYRSQTLISAVLHILLPE